MKRRAFLVTAVALAAPPLALTACNFLDDTPTYRYRMTVEVETPEGLKTGSSVIEVETRMETNPESPASQRINWRARGEAAIIDLEERGVLFALLRSEDDVDFASRIMFLLAPKGVDKNGDAFLGRFANMLEMTEPVELPATQEKINPPLAEMKGRPMLVTFGDLDDPTSVERVDPEDLSATFGEGVSLKRITVQITRDRVTTGIEQRLGWWSKTREAGGGLIPMIKNAKGRYEAAPDYDESLVDLGLSNFSTEAYK